MASKKYCVGCRDNFYNGNNDLGVKECWKFKDAKVVWKKIVPINQRPPWTMEAKRVLNCYNPNGAVCVDPIQLSNP